MDKKQLIAAIGAGLLLVAGFFLKEDVKGLVCGTAAPAVSAPVISQ